MIPTMLQAKLIQIFENDDIAQAQLRPVNRLNADDQSLIDVRNFHIKSDPDPTAEIELSADPRKERIRRCFPRVSAEQQDQKARHNIDSRGF